MSKWKMMMGGLALFGLAACAGMQMPTGGVWGPGYQEEGGSSSAGSGVAVPGPNAQAMSYGEFEQLKVSVEEANMSNQKIDVIVNASQSAYFSAAQVGELVVMLDMKNDRVRVVEAVAERILDLNNPNPIVTKLTFADEKSDVQNIMSEALAARQAEEARLAEEARVAEQRRAEEEAQRAEEARIAEQERQQQAAQQPQGTTDNSGSNSNFSSDSSSSSSSSAYCCLGDKYNECDNAAAAGACMGFGKCIFDCMVSGGSSCDSKCADEYPLIQQCRAVAANDHMCRN